MSQPSAIDMQPGRMILVGAVSYVAAQVLVGVELGLLAAWLVVTKDWSLIAALSATLPSGIPLAVAHMAAFATLGAALSPADTAEGTVA